MGKKTIGGNVTNNPCLEIFLSMLRACRQEDAIAVVITDDHPRREAKRLHVDTYFSFQQNACHEFYKLKMGGSDLCRHNFRSDY